MSPDEWFGTWDVENEEKVTAAKIIMFVIDDLVITGQGKGCFWSGKQKPELNS